jgi:FAD-dependent oxidoreductase domain-containing protein 1
VWKSSPGEVSGISEDGNLTGITLASGDQISCGTLVNAAGAGAGALAAMAGIDLPVGPRKRYVYVFDCPDAGEALHKGPLTVQPNGVWFRPEGRNFICGLSPEEHEEPTVFDFEMDHDAWFDEKIWPALAERVPKFEAIKVISSWVGHYDYNALDQNAIIGRHPDVTNLLFANGFSGHGFQQGPAARATRSRNSSCMAPIAPSTSPASAMSASRNEPLFEKNVI